MLFFFFFFFFILSRKCTLNEALHTDGLISDAFVYLFPPSLPLLSSFYFFCNLDTPFVAFQFHGVMILFWEFREVSAYRSWRASIIRKVLKNAPPPSLPPLFTVSLSSVYRIVWRDLCARFSRDTGKEKRIRERKRGGKRVVTWNVRGTRVATRSRDAPVAPPPRYPRCLYLAYYRNASLVRG